ncbi:TetR family transcriptional regulator [Nocardia sp. NPDC050630]|uniref:TetR family transcriptional regulator n=1 Tax=Nocardia sp. NPDC050630 TaxID=3364321 RepID=UPI0037B61C8E
MHSCAISATQYSFGRPSVNDIAAAADLSKRTVYLYFPTVSARPHSAIRPPQCDVPSARPPASAGPLDGTPDG